MNLYPALSQFIEKRLSEMDDIPEARKDVLHTLASYITEEKKKNGTVLLVFICTHNSRRSHISQIWAATAAAYYGLNKIRCFSGGTEATSFNLKAVAALERAGFWIEHPGGDNPHYLVTFSDKGDYLECFSKRYDDPANPKDRFAAIMTCSHADENCPYLPGAYRIVLTYEDPGAADGLPEESRVYDGRVRQIATELLYAMKVARDVLSVESY